MKRNLSHPSIFLEEHVNQVGLAMEAILHRHSHNWATAARTNSLNIYALIARLHDTGKGSTAFQTYIKDVDGYRGDRLAKAHTPLSLILALKLAIEEKWEPLLALAVAQVVRGHHSGLATRRELDDVLYSDSIAYVLHEQLADLDMTQLAQDSGLNLKKLTMGSKPWLEVGQLIEECWEKVGEMSIDTAIDYRLWIQWLFSILLEADKAFLAVKNPDLYLSHQPVYFLPGLVDDFIGTQDDSPINQLRQDARINVLNGLEKNPDCKIATVTLPTGVGKTATAASWALSLRERLGKEGQRPKIIVVLPFLSIIDQTETVYRSILKLDGQRGEILLPCHSLADRTYDSEMDRNSADFFIDTWRSEVVVTTFDQFLMALLGSKARHQMRFHSLCDSLIIMDEVQTLPCKLWDPLDNILRALVNGGNSRILAMSATMPGFLSNASELVENHKKYFSQFKRYRLVLKHRENQTIDDFAVDVSLRAVEWMRDGKRVLITLNTRKSARMVRDRLESAGAAPLYFLSADVTPRDRLDYIKKIKRNKPCIVVSTQCVEAGVDIDLDFVIRDFAPLDSIVQIAGRCNRNSQKSRCDVEVVSLLNDKGRNFCELMGYDSIHLQETRKVLAGYEAILEEDVIDICSQYFAALASKKDTGAEITKSFAAWEEVPPVRELLRGKEQKQYQFLVIEQDPELKSALAAVSKITDRWERRRTLRSLAGRVAQVTVSVYARSGFIPEDIAEPMKNLWLLKSGYYSSERGIDLPSNLTSGTLIL